ADGTTLREDRLAANPVARHAQHRLIVSQHFLPIEIGRTCEQARGQPAYRRIAMLQENLPARRVDLACLRSALDDARHELAQPDVSAQEHIENLRPQGRAQCVPAGEQFLWYSIIVEAAERTDYGTLNNGRVLWHELSYQDVDVRLPVQFL